MIRKVWIIVIAVHILVLISPSTIFANNHLQVSDTLPSSAWQNPVIPGDIADPSVIKVGNNYYATGTSSEWAPHYPVFTSADLVNWKQVGYVFNKTPEWCASSFWAPELFYYHNTFFVYYTAKRKSDNVSCIGVASSTDPSKGFTDHGIIVDFGKEAIDAFVFEDKGSLYITFKAYGLDKRPIELLAAKLSDDGLTVEGEYFTLLRDDKKIGLEGQVLVKKNNYYYLFYSAGNCCGVGCNYNLRVARSTALKGPYQLYDSNPILAANNTWKCPGHGTIVQRSADEYFYLYHAYSTQAGEYTGRQGMLDKLYWDKRSGWPYFKNASPSARSMSKTLKVASRSFRDDFNSENLLNNWQWDFRHSLPEMKQSEGYLSLTGDTINNNPAGTVLTVRPETAFYEMTTEVTNQNSALKGLVLYGDASQAIGIGVEDNKVKVWIIGDKKLLKNLAETTVDNKPVRLRMTVAEGYKCRFFWSQDNMVWNEVIPAAFAAYDVKYLPPWDRSPRPGLHHAGDKNAPAVFSFFNIVYSGR